MGNFSYKEYIDSRSTSIDKFFTEQVTPSKEKLDTFITKIAGILDSGGEVKFNVYTTASSTVTSSYNKQLSERRIESIKEYILNSKTTSNKLLKDFVENNSLKIKENPLGDNEKNLKTNGIDDIDCSLKFTDNQKNVEAIYSVQAMACRRARISKIEVKPAKPSKKDDDTKPEGAKQDINGASGEKTQNRPQQGSSAPIQETKVYKGLTKKLLRGLLSECSYFEMIKETNPFIYDGIKKKFKNFNPAFHSITPEGLNSRLTFLQQCMRPGDTIPTVKQTNGVNSLSTEQDASNTAFGSPPVLVLRVGDFFNTKIIPDNLSIKFDKGALFDINPEGVGIQPMIATISLTFKFIGGHSLSGPISKLQNALSFNYYANTELYDERSETMDDSFDKIDLEVQKLLDEVQPPKPNEDITNKIGTTIGKVESSTNQSDGTKSGKISYQKNMAEIQDPVKNYVTKTYSALNDISLKYSLGGLYIANTDRKYQEGNVYSVVTKIYGKIENSQKKMDDLFDNFKKDINDDTTPLLSDIDESVFNFKTTEKNKIRKQLKKLADERKSVYIQDFDNYNNTITNEELKLINLIDKINFVSGSKDGFIEKGESIIFQTSGTSEVTPTGDGNSYADTLAELQGDLSIVGNNMNEFVQKLEETKIITNTDEEKWKESFKFDLKISTQIDVYNNRLNMVFGRDIADDTENFINNIVSVLDDEDKDKWKTFLARNIQWDLNTKTATNPEGIYNQYVNQKSIVANRFKEFNDNYLTQKFNTYNPYNKEKKRVFNFSTQIPTNTTDAENLKKLNSTVNSEDNKFNLKFKFK